MKPQIAISAETTRAAHDTFIDTLYGPIATVHRLTNLRTCTTATRAKIKAETTTSSTYYSLPRFILNAPVRALFYLGRAGASFLPCGTEGWDEGERQQHVVHRPVRHPTIAVQESGTYGGRRQSRWLRTADGFCWLSRQRKRDLEADRRATGRESSKRDALF